MVRQRWPGRFVEDVAHGAGSVRATAMLRSPVLWLSALLSMVLLVPGVGSRIDWIDSGELIASAFTLGISHPTGYPLLTFLSRVVVMMAPWVDPVFMLHLLSALFVACAGGFVALLTVLLIGRTGRAGDAAAGGVTASLLFVSAATVWQTGTTYEVYGFQALLYTAALLAVLLGLRDMEGDSGTISRWWIAGGLLVGYGFANHMMTIYLLPGLAWLWWKSRQRVRERSMAAFLAAMTLGISAYLYLPLRALTHPPLNWGDPSSIGSLIDHVSGKQYRVWMFSGLDSFAASAGEFIGSFPMDAGWLALALSMAGLRVLWQRDRTFFWFCIILVVFTIGYSLNYSIHDIETYFLLVHCMIAGSAGVGTWWVMRAIRERNMPRRVLVSVLPFVVLCLNGFYRLDAYREHSDESPEPFAAGVLAGVDAGATILTGKWDFLYSPALALQHVRGERPDVRMIDLHLLRDRSWYVREVLKKFGDDRGMLVQSGNAFLEELRKFEQGKQFNPQVIQMRWQEFLTQLLAVLASSGPLYTDHEIVAELPRLFEYRPEGYLLRAAVPDLTARERRLPEYWPIGNKNDEFARSYRRFCSTAFLNHGLFARSEGDTLLFAESIDWASHIDPENPYLRGIK